MAPSCHPPEYFRQLKVYVAPDNPAGRHLVEELSASGVQVLGIIDNLKTGVDVINHAERAQPYDAVLVARSDYQPQIAAGMCERGFDSDRIWFLQTEGRHYQRYRVPSLLHSWSQRFLSRLRRLPLLLPQLFTVYYAEKFVDSNVLVAFDYHQARGSGVRLVVREPDRLFHPAQCRYPWLGWLYLCCAKVLVMDHETTDPLLNQLRQRRKVVQLWHGLPFKYLAGNKHFPHVLDHCFVSSSAWFNQHVFPQMFKARSYLASGYPRNDALVQASAARCWYNTLPAAQLEQLRQGRKLVLYMPTYRDNGNDQPPIDWLALDQLLQALGAVLVVKNHPFLAPFDELRTQPDCAAIFHYPGRRNVYPWLADADLLITDYSSVAFDFLGVDRPIIHFMYDLAEYRQVRGRFLIDSEDFIAGDVATDFADLCQALQHNLAQDQHSEKRRFLREKFAINTDVATPALVSYIEQLR